MATSGHDADNQDLNLVLKSLGERGKEAQLWKERDQHVASFLLEKISEFLKKETENRIMARPYGSSAEDLKCLTPEDYGDVDIMIFPNADDSVVYEDLLEYSAENLIHAKIKGSDHPMLQSCLVEDTDYVATSAVKKFHPAIYGTTGPGCIDVLTTVMKAMSREDLVPFPECVVKWKNKDNSPAFNVDLKQSFETQSEEFQSLIDAGRWYNLDVAQVECLFSAMNCASRGVEYTREHAEALEDHCKRMGEILNDWVTKAGNPSGIIQGFPGVFQEILWGDATENFKARVQAIESRSQNESGSRTEEDVCHGQQPVTPENRDTDEAESSIEPPRDEPFVTPQNSGTDSERPTESASKTEEDVCHGQQPVTPENRDTYEAESSIEPPRDLPFVTPQNSDTDSERPTEESRFNSREDFRKCSEESMATTQEIESKGEKEGDKTDKTEPDSANTDDSEDQAELEKATEKEETSNDGKEEEEKRKNAKIAGEKHFFKHLGLTTEVKSDTEKMEEYKRNVGIDLVPALRSRGWPKVAREWIKRDRKWPSPEMVDKVVQEGFHLVVKPPKANGNPDCDFRISFSHAEYLLSQEMNDIQRECYRCLKKYHRAYLSKPAGLVTFHLKNLLLQTIEETGAEMWTESNRVECMMTLLWNLLEALAKKNLPHYFVRAYNLFGADYIEDPKGLEYLAMEVEKIIESPVELSNKLIQNQDEMMSKKVEKEESVLSQVVPSSEPTTPVKPEKACRPGGNDDTQSKKETSTLPLLPTETTQASNPTRSYRYHDLEDIYLQVSKELVDMALNHASLETLDPLERSLVEDLRELASIHGLTQETFLKMLKCGWGTAYYKVFINTEPDMRRRMVDAIHGQVEIWKYALKQEDFGPGNEEAIGNRMMDPSNDDPFDLNHVIPAGGAVQVFRSFVNSLTLQPTQPQIADMDDIPLD